MTPRIVVLGGSFAGLSAAFKLKRELGDQAEVTVVSRDPRFVFIPSLIWVVPGWRKPGQISFDLGPALRRRGIGFTLATAARILPAENKLVTDQGEVGYDYLLIATGPKYDWAVVPNFGPADGTTWSVCNLPHAMEAAKAWLDFVQDPGPVVIGSTQGASCFGAEYEVAFNIDRALRQAKIRRQAPLTFFTAEPFLGHFGIGGMRGGETMLKGYFKMLGIEAIANVSATAVEKGAITLSDGRELAHKYAIVIPPFTGVQAILDSGGWATPAASWQSTTATSTATTPTSSPPESPCRSSRRSPPRCRPACPRRAGWPRSWPRSLPTTLPPPSRVVSQRSYPSATSARSASWTPAARA